MSSKRTKNAKPNPTSTDDTERVAHCATCGGLFAASIIRQHLEQAHSTPLKPMASGSKKRKPQRPVSWVKCLFCNVHLPSDALEPHLVRRHQRERASLEAAQKKARRTSPRKACVEGAQSVFLTLPDQTQIFSSRTRRLLGVEALLRRCRVCGRSHQVMHQYPKTSAGSVVLCEACRAAALDRQHGRLDAMDFAVSGGGFETNRRRH